VFFTGDVSQTASVEDYDASLEFVTKLLEKTKIDKSNLFIVPGNHDVNRLNVIKVLDDQRFRWESNEDLLKVVEDERTMDLFLKRFDNYSKFLNNLYGTSEAMTHENYYYGHTRELAGVEFGIVGLNSAWASHGGRQDSNHIYVSEFQVDNALSIVSEAQIKIALLHHPLSWLYEHDMASVENLLRRHCQVVLHGHIHRADFNLVTSISASQIIIPAGSGFMNRGHSNNYNITELNFDNQTIRIAPRLYFDHHRKFLKDISSMGVDDRDYYETDLPKSMQINA
jgi:predicted phosphodiesterase